ncbi:MAG: hypothetical protein ACREDD_05240 [Methylocella sp.]
MTGPLYTSPAALTGTGLNIPPANMTFRATAATAATPDNSTNIETTAWAANQKPVGSFQSFGAVGDGVTDDTAAVSAALNSGVPLTCNGTFKITSLVTITNISVYLQGGGTQGCKLLLSNAQSMFYFNLTSSLLNQEHVVIKDVRVQVGAVISSVTGPAQTAAFYISFPSGSISTASPTVTIKDVQIQGTVAGNYIRNGIYLNDCTDVEINKYTYEGNRSTFISGTRALVYDGTHSPVLMTASNVYADFAGIGIYAPQQTATGWQGIRIDSLDCVFCTYAILLEGALDGLSDYAEIMNSEGAVNASGVFVQNALHVKMDGNYFFFSPIDAVTNAAFPTCYQYIWTIAIPVNGGASSIENNRCDGAQAIGYTGRYGWNAAGISRSNMVLHIGSNQLTNLDFGGALQPGTAGVLVEHQSMKNVTTEVQDSSAAGDNTFVPPLAVVNGATKSAGLVGEMQKSSKALGSAISLTSGTAKDIATISITAGHWSCYGNVGFIPGATTTITLMQGGISTTANTMPAAPASMFSWAAAWTTGSGDVFPINTSTFDVTVTTTLHLVAKSNFGTSTQSAYGFIECQRTE